MQSPIPNHQSTICNAPPAVDRNRHNATEPDEPQRKLVPARDARESHHSHPRHSRTHQRHSRTYQLHSREGRPLNNPLQGMRMETGARKMKGAIIGRASPKQPLRLVIQRSPKAGILSLGMDCAQARSGFDVSLGSCRPLAVIERNLHCGNVDSMGKL